MGRQIIGLMPPRHKQAAAAMAQGGGGAGDPSQDVPVDMNLVKGILRDFDRMAHGETFRGDRLAKITVLGKGV